MAKRVDIGTTLPRGTTGIGRIGWLLAIVGVGAGVAALSYAASGGATKSAGGPTLPTGGCNAGT
jgi:hypothetical protein